MRVLFVTWDGPQVTYLEGLFLPIFEHLGRLGHAVCVLQFTWGDSARVRASQAVCERAGVDYRSVRVWRRPAALGAFLSAVLGARAVRRAVQDWRIDVVMPRSVRPALSVLLARPQRLGVRCLFDADGLPLDERVDFGGLSPCGLHYRIFRDIEAQAVRRADAVLTRSLAACEILLARAGAGTSPEKFHVVTNGRDETLFNPATAEARGAARRSLGIEEAVPLVVYAGSCGEQYCIEEMLCFFRLVLARRSDARLLLLTGEPEGMRRLLVQVPDVESATTLLRVPIEQVPALLSAADLGMALRRPTFSMRAVAPVKLGEYLLCGLPVLATSGIGDSDALVTPEVGYLLDDMRENRLSAAADWLVDAVLSRREAYRAASRTLGLARFGLSQTVEQYRVALDAAMLGRG